MCKLFLVKNYFRETVKVFIRKLFDTLKAKKTFSVIFVVDCDNKKY